MLATITIVLVSMMLGAQTQDDVSRLDALQEQAAAAQNAGRYEEAERLHRAVLDGATLIPGFPANQLARLLSNLASVLNLQNRADEALPLLRRAQELLEKQPSSDPAQYSSLHGNFGHAYAQQGDLKAAEREYNESIDVLTKAGVTDRRYLFEFDYGLGYVYWKTGRLVEARRRYEAAPEGVRAIAPPSHPIRQQWEQEYQAIVNELRK